MEFEQLNIDWNADPNAPCLRIETVNDDVTITFYVNAYQFTDFKEGDEARVTFHDCLQYRYGAPNDEGFYMYGQSRFKELGVEWGEFYQIHDSNWKEDFPNPIHVSEKDTERHHYLFYFRDNTFECIAASYDVEFLLTS